jgi:DeoR family fructose operon transcriptional repressor
MQTEQASFFAEERKQKMLEHLERHKKVTVPELSDMFGVSNVTIRNDLNELESVGLLTRTHGGAMLKNKTGSEPDLNQRKIFNLVGKQRIAQLALPLIEDGDTIVLDAGNTTLELAKLLVRKQNLTVVTNGLEIALALEDMPHGNIIFMGGMIRKGFHCSISLPTDNLLKGLTVDKAFMACNSLSIERGASTPEMLQAETKKLMISVANKVILLSDYTKMGKDSFVQFAPLSILDVLVTDNISEEDKKQFEEQDIQVIS